MNWSISGADSQTGENRTILLAADSVAAAEALARHQGMLIASIQPVKPAERVPASSLSQIAAALPPPVPAEYARPMDQEYPPDYRGLRVGAKFLRFAAWWAYGLGCIAALQALLYFLGTALQFLSSNLRVSIDFFDRIYSPMQAIVSLWPLVLGAFLQAAAEACNALRDIARNSFPHEAGTRSPHKP